MQCEDDAMMEETDADQDTGEDRLEKCFYFQ